MHCPHHFQMKIGRMILLRKEGANSIATPLLLVSGSSNYVAPLGNIFSISSLSTSLRNALSTRLDEFKFQLNES